jgi:hypothetical protein
LGAYTLTARRHSAPIRRARNKRAGSVPALNCSAFFPVPTEENGAYEDQAQAVVLGLRGGAVHGVSVDKVRQLDEGGGPGRAHAGGYAARGRRSTHTSPGPSQQKPRCSGRSRPARSVDDEVDAFSRAMGTSSRSSTTSAPAAPESLEKIVRELTERKQRSGSSAAQTGTLKRYSLDQISRHAGHLAREVATAESFVTSCLPNWMTTRRHTRSFGRSMRSSTVPGGSRPKKNDELARHRKPGSDASAAGRLRKKLRVSKIPGLTPAIALALCVTSRECRGGGRRGGVDRAGCQGCKSTMS